MFGLFKKRCKESDISTDAPDQQSEDTQEEAMPTDIGEHPVTEAEGGEMTAEAEAPVNTPGESAM